MQLPLLGRRIPELETCAFCPKLSRAACPVSSADGRETTTPWGKMTAAYLVARDAVEPTQAQASPAWACTGCFACKSACDLKNDVAGTLLDARADFTSAGLAPDESNRVIERHKTRTAEADVGLAAAIERARARGAAVATTPEAMGRTMVRLVVGCLSARTGVESKTGDDVAADAIVATAALAGAHAQQPIGVVGGCCGAPLRMAGDRTGFVAAGRALADRVRGATTVVVADAGCTHAIARRYAEVAVELPGGLEVLHLTELAARNLQRLPAPRTDALASEEVRYHDACALGRGLLVYEPPRAVLTRLLGRPPGEFARKRDEATCAGGGGLLPVTYGENAQAIAEARRQQHRSAGGGTIVTTCASSKKAMSRDGSRVLDVATLLARALGR